MKRKIKVLMLAVFVSATFNTKNARANYNEPVKENTTNSVIKSVTVFSDRARVTRISKGYFQKGIRKIVFKGLPERIEQKSITVKGEGNAILKDIKFKKEYFVLITNKDIQKINKQKTVLTDSLRILKDETSSLNKEKDFVEKIIQKTVHDNKKDEVTELDPNKWINMINFYRDKINNLNKSIRTAEKKIRYINERVSKLNKQIDNAGNQDEKSVNNVVVTFEAKSSSNIFFELAYIVYGPSWQPVYDIYVNTDKKEMQINYNAMIQQGTNEDWTDTQIKLSTAKTDITGNQPLLEPLHLYLQNNPTYNPINRTKNYNTKSKKNDQITHITIRGSASYSPIRESSKKRTTKKRTSKNSNFYNEAGLETGATAVVFVVNGKNTVKSDNQKHKVYVKRNTYDAYIRYSSVPKLAPFAYLKAKVKNTSEFTYLRGETNIFLDKNYVSSSYMDIVSPNEEFWTYLGIDEGIKIKYKTIRNYMAEEGVLSKKNVVTNEYLIEVTNNKKNVEEIVIWDQCPITNSEKLKVEIIKPKDINEKPNIRINEHKYIEWVYKLKPGEKKQIPFKYSIEYPKGKFISGM